MTRVKTKRKRPLKWLVAFYRPVGEFKNGERKMITAWDFVPLQFPNLGMAIRRQMKTPREPYVPFIQRKGNKPRKVTEIQVYDPDHDYPAE
jgi:hypothetical protein